ncbi:hypothetical protein CLV86_2277 [Lacinutrix venerupis]|uniref:Uncharacterized protein n=1 Tax=Lacinutrix venerupis TaxID=1486034 RepID=A0AAC9PVZ5_9FLAO|nr:hypothetical protein [Lacinutrix venerupis]APX99545.1 hypothetical protein BWR22_04180 [Lacinutrix venerupis]RLJ61884.1 hypothetical protein CLV86_2277 [Lacinutrix venerupis]
MKKIFTFCFFAFALLIGTQSALAQDNAKVNEKAYLKAKELRSTLKFDDNTLEKVYKAYQAYEYKFLSISEHQESGSSDYNNSMATLNNTLQEGIKNALGNDLYKRYLIINELEHTVD